MSKIAVAALAFILLMAVYAYTQFGLPETVSDQQIAMPPPTPLLIAPIPDSIPDATEIRRGQYLTLSGDCVACHTRKDGAPFAGGYPMRLPFGVIYTENLTSNVRTGIGNWTPEQFYNAIHNGRGVHGEFLYPAFPYVYFTHLSRADSDAILAFLKTVPAQSYSPPANKLPFPANVRALISGWNVLFFTPGEFVPNPQKSSEWNRGAYLVTGPAHCGDCHTPKNFLGGDDKQRTLQGATVENWVAPDLTSNLRVGLGRWNVQDIIEYLKTGRNVHANADATMAEVVSNSTSLMTDQDLHAIATYLKDQPSSDDRAFGSFDTPTMERGSVVYFDACAGCHLAQGEGQPRFFPPLRANAMAQQSDPSGLIHLILAGGRTAPTPTRPSGLSMPSFAWKLTDDQIVDVATYVRNSWGNRASPVSISEVRNMRQRLDLEDTHPKTVPTQSN